MNRAVYKLNEGVDTAAMKPLAQDYNAIVPAFMRDDISNCFANINDIDIAMDNLLQGKFVNAGSDLERAFISTTIGVAGLFDAATHFELQKHDEDFGQTLGYWGIGAGPHIMLPILGPSSLRDVASRVVDAKLDAIGFLRAVPLRNSLWSSRVVIQRADLMDISRWLDIASLDLYAFLLDAYLLRRRNLIFDGSPPAEHERSQDDSAADLTGNHAGQAEIFPLSCAAWSLLAETSMMRF
jgi:phospholipid-binding lipoprotein MlaA